MVDILEASIFQPDDPINGFEQDDLGNIWWQTFLAIPSDENPLLFEDATDPDGAAGSSQKASLTRTDSIQFLAGIFNETGEAERTITVPGGSVFFFPILNAFLPDPSYWCQP